MSGAPATWRRIERTGKVTAGGYDSRPSPFRTGLACRCPRCGRGKLFKGFLGLQDRCSACGLDLSKADSGDGPAVFIMLLLGAVIVFLALMVEIRYTPPLWVHALIWPPLILGGAIGMLRPMKATLIALQYRNKASESGRQNYD
jgi:uncharacterized protein (DUF983 family)